jgi:hypothetical protein
MNQRIISSKTNYNEDPRRLVDANQQKNSFSIHFDYDNENVTSQQLTQFSTIVADELDLRGLIIGATLTSRVETLRDCLTQEWLLRSIATSIHHSDRCSDKPFLSLIDYVPCILHLENRKGI